MNTLFKWAVVNVVVIAIGMVVFSYAGIIKPGVGNAHIGMAVGAGLVAAILSMIVCASDLRDRIHGRLWLFVFLVAGVPAGLSLGFWGEHVKSNTARSLLSAAHLPEHLDEYRKVDSFAKQKGQKYVRGKAVVIDADQHDFSDLHFELPNDLAPSDASDVGSAIHVRWKQFQVGKYSNGAIAYQWLATAVVYDLRAKAISAVMEIQGGEPPKTTKSTGSDSGSKPLKEIIERLVHLQRRPWTVDLMNKTNPKVDGFLRKAKTWREEFEELRSIILDCPLTEELKWGKPCYTFQEGNVVLIHGFKEYCAILFFKGALLKDAKGVLIQQTENVQAARQIRFTSVRDIGAMKTTLTAYIHEAIEVEKAGLKVPLKKTSEFTIPDEFQKELDEIPALKNAFAALTPGRQRAYLHYFSAAKQSKTRESRVGKNIPRILKGKGLDDE